MNYLSTNTGVVRWDSGRTNLNKYIKKFNKWDKSKHARKGINLILAVQEQIDNPPFSDDWEEYYYDIQNDILKNDGVDDMLNMLWQIRQGSSSYYRV